MSGYTDKGSQQDADGWHVVHPEAFTSAARRQVREALRT
jgi:hypothetical protein